MNENVREKEIIKTSFVGILGNVLLVTFKAIVGVLAGSIAIIMDALNNLTDALSSLITIVGTKLSQLRPNKKHPYGYGRIEYITSSLIATLILFAGGTAIIESVKSLIDYYKNKTAPTFEVYSLIIIAAAIIVKILIGLLFRSRGKKISSDALTASGTDALFDSILSLSTLVSAIFIKYLGFYVEGYLGIIIGIFILKTGFEVMKESLSDIVGERFDKEYIDSIKKEILSVDGVLGVYDLIINSYGHNKNIASVHIGVDDDLRIRDIQKIERKIGFLMYYKYNTIMTVGVYGERISDKKTKDIYEKVIDIIQNYPTVLQIHGFYLDDELNILNFDLVISFDDEKPLETIDNIKKDVEGLNTGYEVFIQYDQDFSLS